MEILLWVLAVVLIALGIAGVILPALPGVPAVFFGLLFAAWADGFTKTGALTLTIIGIMAGLSILLDFLVTTLGAKKMGASKTAILGSVIGTVIGIFFGVLGIIIGPFAGSALGEYYDKRDILKAGKVGLGTWAGLVFGMALKIAVIFFMIGLFIISYLI